MFPTSKFGSGQTGYEFNKSILDPKNGMSSILGPNLDPRVFKNRLDLV